MILLCIFSMGMKLTNILVILLLSLLASTVVADQTNVFDVTSSKYGGKPDSDISNPLTTAWTDACSSTSTSTVLVPRGTYQILQEVTFEGPCKAPIRFKLQGTLQAPKDRSKLDDSWIHFTSINKLTLSGGGTFDGQGELSWKKESHGSTPVDIRFKTINDSIVCDITAMNSAKFHMSVHDSNNITFQRLTITAPEDSPNTDGIHIASSSKITVSDSHIATGDDCVSIGDGASKILVSNITCGPGHGISIGSLGKYENEQPVAGITVKNCTLTGTTNGARIKTWPDSPGKSIAWNIVFQDIIMVNVKNPILIDQYYCDKGKACKPKTPSKVQISDVSFKNIKGSSISPVAVKINCSKTNPCRNVQLSNIDLSYSGEKKEELTSECGNVKPRITGVTKALACANLGDIPIQNPPLLPPSTSAPLTESPPEPVQLSPTPPREAEQSSPPPPPPEAEHSPPPLPPAPFVSPPQPPSLPPVLPLPPLPSLPPLSSPPPAPAQFASPLQPPSSLPPLLPPPLPSWPPFSNSPLLSPPPPPPQTSDDSPPPMIMIYTGPELPSDDGGFGPTSSAAGKKTPTVVAIVLTSAMALGLLHALL